MTTYEYLNLIASYGGLGMIFYGIRVMAKNADMRAADSERKHNEAMTESRRSEQESLRRHEETMTALSQSNDALHALIDGQAESPAALRELIERSR